MLQADEGGALLFTALNVRSTHAPSPGQAQLMDILMARPIYSVQWRLASGRLALYDWLE